MRKKENSGWDEIFEDAEGFCLVHYILVPIMEDEMPVIDQRGRGSQLVTYYDHFHLEIFNVALDQIIVELNNHFAKRSTQLRCIS